MTEKTLLSCVGIFVHVLSINYEFKNFE